MTYDRNSLDKEAMAYNCEVRDSKFKGAGLGLFCVKGLSFLFYFKNP
jgi:hypothetical protein